MWREGGRGEGSTGRRETVWSARAASWRDPTPAPRAVAHAQHRPDRQLHVLVQRARKAGDEEALLGVLVDGEGGGRGEEGAAERGGGVGVSATAAGGAKGATAAPASPTRARSPSHARAGRVSGRPGGRTAPCGSLSGRGILGGAARRCPLPAAPPTTPHKAPMRPLPPSAPPLWAAITHPGLARPTRARRAGTAAATRRGASAGRAVEARARACMSASVWVGGGGNGGRGGAVCRRRCAPAPNRFRS